MLFVACIWYLVLTTVLSVGQYYLERRFARGSTAQAAGLTPSSASWPTCARAE